MFVNEEYARLTSKTATYGDKTYYFCMDKCRDEFEKEPEKYADQKTSDAGEHKHPAAVQTDDKSWLEMLAPEKGSHVIKKKGSYPGQEMKRTIGTPGGSHDVIDWDGPDQEGAPPRDWTGWGKFPGARYLGIHDDKKKITAQHNEMPDSDGDTKTEKESDSEAASTPQPNAGHSGMQHTMPKQPPQHHQPTEPAER